MKTIAVNVCFVLASLLAVGAEEFTAASEGGKPRPATVAVDFSAACGPVKPMNAVNNGPVGGSADARHGNFAEYRAARIPFARTHDASEYIVYGGDHVADITAMFPDFDADENDPKSYDFAVTDAYLRNMRAAGTEPFFRLGQRIEHAAKRYNVWPPKDFAKWARICEHVIRHYNRGWADGFEWNIKYWEIWNEPDIDMDWRKTGLPRMWRSRATWTTATGSSSTSARTARRSTSSPGTTTRATRRRWSPGRRRRARSWSGTATGTPSRS